MTKSRAEPGRGRGQTPSKPALRSAQTAARQDPERGVSSRVRKRTQRLEVVPDPHTALLAQHDQLNRGEFLRARRGRLSGLTLREGAKYLSAAQRRGFGL